jgi:hypothetical protein
LGYKVAWTHSVLIGRKKSKAKTLSCFPYNHAQRPANTASGLPGDPSDPLRWDGIVAAFLQQAGTPSWLLTIHSAAASQCQLPSFRFDPGSVVLDYGWTATHQQNRDLAIQRYLSFLVGLASISGPVYPASLSQADAGPSDPPTGGSTRSTAFAVILLAQTTNDSNLRLGLGRPDGLRPHSMGSSGLQPQEAGTTLLPSTPLCFEAHLQEFWHGSLRPGDAASSTGVVPFLKLCMAKVPKPIARSRIRVRADSGFFGRRSVEFLDARGCGYAIVAREYPHIKSRARGCRFQRLGHGWEVGEFHYQPLRWEEPHRFVVVRRPIPHDPVEAKQLTLFKDRKYAYHMLVTNLKTHPWRVWQFYAKRATIEKNIRELLYDYPLGKIPTDDWKANVAFFQILLFAFNLVHWFKRLCLPKEYLHVTLDTIRTDFLVLPAKLTKEGSKNVLVLPHDYHYQKEFTNALKTIDRLRLS